MRYEDVISAYEIAAAISRFANACDSRIDSVTHYERAWRKWALGESFKAWTPELPGMTCLPEIVALITRELEFVAGYVGETEFPTRESYFRVHLSDARFVLVTIFGDEDGWTCGVTLLTESWDELGHEAIASLYNYKTEE